MFTVTVMRSVRIGRMGLAAVLTVVGGLAVAGQPAAQAGGTPAAECPSGREYTVSAPGDEPDAGTPVQLAAGYYAQTASFWPPRSAILCETGSGRAQPSAGVAASNDVGCGTGARELLVPDEIPAGFESAEVARSGAYLPAGWYTLAAELDASELDAQAAGSAGTARSAHAPSHPHTKITWTAVCWYRTAPPAATPDPAKPDVVKPDVVKPESAKPDAVQPDVG
ncbi:hypothetical protein IHE48_26145 [Frankia sp. CH37]|nr:hypothetical protein [Parafrankia sp. CH37]